MGQLVSDVQSVLDYKKNKQEAKSQRQKILADMAADEQTKVNLVKKHWRPSAQNTVRRVCQTVA